MNLRNNTPAASLVKALIAAWLVLVGLALCAAPTRADVTWTPWYVQEGHTDYSELAASGSTYAWLTGSNGWFETSRPSDTTPHYWSFDATTHFPHTVSASAGPEAGFDGSAWAESTGTWHLEYDYSQKVYFNQDGSTDVWHSAQAPNFNSYDVTFSDSVTVTGSGYGHNGSQMVPNWTVTASDTTGSSSGGSLSGTATYTLTPASSMGAPPWDYDSVVGEYYTYQQWTLTLPSQSIAGKASWRAWDDNNGQSQGGGSGTATTDVYGLTVQPVGH